MNSDCYLLFALLKMIVLVGDYGRDEWNGMDEPTMNQWNCD